MKIKITITEEFREAFRQGLKSVLTVFKYTCLLVGIICVVLSAMSADLTPNSSIKVMVVGIICIATTMLVEMFIVRFLVKPGERVFTLFSFNFYGDKSEELN